MSYEEEKNVYIYEARSEAFHCAQHGKTEKGFCGKHQAGCRIVLSEKSEQRSNSSSTTIIPLGRKGFISLLKGILTVLVSITDVMQMTM